MAENTPQSSVDARPEPRCPDCGGPANYWPDTGEYICDAPFPYIDPINGCGRGWIAADEVV